ncbi:hypothetical protein GCM10027449_28060 [Sinomonas notoginsengisoli]
MFHVTEHRAHRRRGETGGARTHALDAVVPGPAEGSLGQAGHCGFGRVWLSRVLALPAGSQVSVGAATTRPQ